MDSNIIFLMKNYLSDIGVIDIKNDTNAVKERQKGKEFTFSEHLKGLIYSLLTNQRQWSTVEPKLPQIDKLFFYYDVKSIKSHSGSYFEEGIRKLKCGNRSIKMQMEGLHYNISVFEKISHTYGSLDAYVTSKKPDVIVSEISSGKYKLKGIGVALAWEYLRNVGIDGAKPDTHLKRFMGSDRMGISKHQEALDVEVINEVRKLAASTGLTPFDIDYIIWCYCANGKGEICTSNPRCNICVIKEYCNHFSAKRNESNNPRNNNKQTYKKDFQNKSASLGTYKPADYFVDRIRNEKLLKEDMFVPNGEVQISKTIKLINNEFDLGGKCTRRGAIWFRWTILISAILILLGGLLVTIITPPAGLLFIAMGILLFRYNILLKRALKIQIKTYKRKNS